MNSSTKLMKKFDITYYCGPRPGMIDKPNITADIAASGMTLVPVHAVGTVATNKQAFAALNKYGMRAITTDNRLFNLIYSCRGDLNAVGKADEIVRQIVEDYKDVVNLDGWDIQDEPGAHDFPILAAIVKAFRRYAPGKETCINLFPNYASAPDQLFTPDYRSYVENFINVVNPDYLSYDHYHFRGRKKLAVVDDENISEAERQVRIAAIKEDNRAGFFENISVIRELALKYNLPAMLIILLSEHGNYRNLTRGEIFWEVNMCLAYGMKRISYFTYIIPDGGDDDFWGYKNAMIDQEGNKLPHYYDVQAINKAIYPIGSYLFDRTSEAVFHIGEALEGEPLFESYRNIKSIDGTDGVISFFDDGSIYLVNRNFAGENTFTLHSDEPLVIFRDDHFENLDSNIITLGAGEAVLLK